MNRQNTPKPEQSRRYTDQTEQLLAFTTELNRVQTMEELLAAVGRTAVALGGANRVAIFLQVADGTARCAWQQGLSPEYAARAAELGAPALAQRAPMLVPDVHDLAEDAVLRRLTEPEGCRSAGLWPLTYEGGVAGYLCCLYDDVYQWSESRRGFFQAFCSQAAVAIENGRLRQAQQRKNAEQEVLLGLSRRLRVARTPEEMYQIVCEQALGFAGAQFAGINLLDPGREIMTRVYAIGPDGGRVSGHKIPVHGSMSETAMKNAAALRGNDFWRTRPGNWAPTYYEQLGPFIIVPLRSHEEIIGTLLLARDKTTGRAFEDDEVRLLESIGEVGGESIRRARLDGDLQGQMKRLQILYDISQRLRATRTPDEACATLGKEAIAAFGAAYGVLALLSPDRRTLTRVFSEGLGARPRGSTFSASGGPSEEVLRTGAACVTEDITTVRRHDDKSIRSPELGPYVNVALRSEEGIIGVVALARLRSKAQPFTAEEVRLLETIAEVGGTAIRRAQLHQDSESRMRLLQNLYEASQAFAESLDVHQLATNAVRVCVERFGAGAAWLGRAEADGTLSMVAYHPATTDFARNLAPRWDGADATGPFATALRRSSPEVTYDIRAAGSQMPWDAGAVAAGLHSAAAFPLVSRTRTFGVLNLYGKESEFFTPERVEFFRSYTQQLAGALENARLFAEASQRLDQLEALRAIDMAITGSFDLRRTLNIVLERAMARLNVDAADVLVFDARTQTLSVTASRGFRAPASRVSELRLGEGIAGRAALDRRMVVVPDLRRERDASARGDQLTDEQFVSCYAVPLIAKGQIRGVLEVYHRAPLDPEPEWLEFLEAIAGQTAIAVENGTILEDLQRTYVELALAYDGTIEGWSRALDLRDNETEGHTKRVTDLTLQLARHMSVSAADFTHLRRGALLHDIGKMAIPDKILLKPGPLSDEEWVIMRRHPAYAYELLATIPYLRPALDIPYYHHEKWDGTGYPRGLKGEQIPLVARIFAVVDVWDALRSDRPYRKAWSSVRAVEYIREQSGKHFDPRVVDAFLKMVPKDDSMALAS
jgi:putative nucleotidyltransferase with HDIG domain